MPLVIFFQGSIELGFPKIGPERLGHHQLSIGNLPEQKIADPHLAAGANEHIGVGDVARVEMLRKDLFGNVGRVKLPPAQSVPFPGV